MSEEDRYDRQRRISWWDQEKVSKGRVAIVGGGRVAEYVALCLTGMGVGYQRLISDKTCTEFLDHTYSEETDYVNACREVLLKINPEVHFRGINDVIETRSDQAYVSGVDIVIDATNDQTSKAILARKCASESISMYSVSTEMYFGRVARLTNENDIRFLMPDLQDKAQGEIPSLTMAALCSNEVIKELHGHTDLLQTPHHLNLRNSDYFSHEQLDTPELDRAELGRRKVMIVGAGALGNFVALLYARLGVGTIYIMDHDVIKDHNLTRQPLLYGMVGESKAQVLADRVRKIGKGTVHHANEKFTSKFYLANPRKKETLQQRKEEIFARTDINKQKKNRLYTRVKRGLLREDQPKIISACVDSFHGRAIIENYSAIVMGIPMVSGGTSPLAGEVALYIPGKTDRIIEQIDMMDAAIRSYEQERSNSCLDRTEGSVVTSNALVASLQVAASLYAICRNYPHCPNGTIHFRGDQPERLAYLPRKYEQENFFATFSEEQTIPKEKISVQTPRFDLTRKLAQVMVREEQTDMYNGIKFNRPVVSGAYGLLQNRASIEKIDQHLEGNKYEGLETLILDVAGRALKGMSGIQPGQELKQAARILTLETMNLLMNPNQPSEGLAHQFSNGVTERTQIQEYNESHQELFGQFVPENTYASLQASAIKSLFWGIEDSVRYAKNTEDLLFLGAVNIYRKLCKQEAQEKITEFLKNKTYTAKEVFLNTIIEYQKDFLDSFTSFAFR